ncbi:MAG: putative membrane protein YfcA [Cocleimonas sp.]|jgi:uncharacterized membrane protein YfcA
MDFINNFTHTSLTQSQFIAISLIFIWSGFVRSGIGFGGAALALPLLLLVYDQPLYFLPIVGSHLLFFSILTLTTRMQNVNWRVLGKVLAVVIIPKIAGIFGLLNLPNNWLVISVFSITLFYGVIWLFNYTIRSQSKVVDVFLLSLGGYTSGTSLIGAPMIITVVARYVSKYQLRETLFVLWVVLVLFKLGAFVYVGVDLQWQSSLVLLPFVGIGHYLGLRAHDYFLNADSTLFHRILGGALITVSSVGLIKYFL